MATTYQGFLGAWTSYNSSTVGAANSFEITFAQDMLDDTAFGEKWVGRKGGLASWSGRGTMTFDYADLGQKALADALIVAAPVSAGATAVFTLYTGKTITGVIIVSSFRVSDAVADKVTADVEFVGDGAPTLA